MMSRRDALKLSAAAVLVPGVAALSPAQAAFSLAPLPYAFDALEPFIDARTMEIHSQRHHKAYVDNLNNALAGMNDWLSKPIAEVISNLSKLPADKQTAVRNNGGGHYNHDLFWKIMAKPGTGGGKPKGDLAKAIDEAFGSFDKFQATFKDAAMKRFGSGWAWLVPGRGKPLAVVSSPNQDNTLMDGGPAPILGIDVWEHAYYLKYQNKRADYVDAWWNVVNWDVVSENYSAARKS